MIVRSRVTGLVLAGGLGRRMGTDDRGFDKGLASFRGRTLVEHVIERLAPQVSTLVVSANRNRERYREFGHPVLADEIGGYAGPLAGLHAALGACRTAWLASAPCDSPFLPPDLVERLAAAASRAGAPVALARAAGRTQPAFLLVAREVLPQLDAYLAAGHRKVDAWCASLHAAHAEFDDASAFANINTLEELARCESAIP